MTITTVADTGIAKATRRHTLLVATGVLILTTAAFDVAVAKPRAANAAASGTLTAQLSTPAVSASTPLPVLTFCGDNDPASCQSIAIPNSGGVNADGIALNVPYTMGNASSVPTVATYAGSPLPDTVNGATNTVCGGKTGVLLSATGATFQNSGATVTLTHAGQPVGQPVAVGGGSSQLSTSIFKCLSLG